MNKEFFFTISKEDSGQRIDKHLGSKLAQLLSRSAVKKLIESGAILLNEKKIKPHYKLKENDKVSVYIEEKVPRFPVEPTDIPLEIIYEDDYLLVINKPAGLVVHPAPGHYNDTLVNALIFHLKKVSDINGPFRLGIVHRLDKETSGLLVVAKDNNTHRHLAEQFKRHKTKKMYIAIVKGKIEREEGLIEAPISRSHFNRKKMAVSYGAARQAETYYKVLSRSKDLSVLEIHPKTGRTHQIRVHFSHIGHPVLGDKSYGGLCEKNPIDRQALHAKKLGFIHPVKGKFVEFEAPIPQDMLRIIESLEV